MKASHVLQDLAFILIVCVAICADSLGDLPHGFTIMFAALGVAGVLLYAAERKWHQ